MPSNNIPKIKIPNVDKGVHVFFYLVLSILMSYGWKNQELFSSLRRSMLFKILMIASAYGFLIETMQGLFTADRQFDMLDVAANATGAALGSLISVKLFK